MPLVLVVPVVSVRPVSVFLVLKVGFVTSVLVLGLDFVVLVFLHLVPVLGLGGSSGVGVTVAVGIGVIVAIGVGIIVGVTIGVIVAVDVGVIVSVSVGVTSVDVDTGALMTVGATVSLVMDRVASPVTDGLIVSLGGNKNEDSGNDSEKVDIETVTIMVVVGNIVVKSTDIILDV